MKKTTSRTKPAVRNPAQPASAATEAKDVKGDGGGLVKEPDTLDAGEQRRAFDAAASLFQSGQYQQALQEFRRAAQGPNREMGHTAQLYARMCQRRLDAAVTPRTAEEHYNLAVALVNERRFQEAEAHLHAALSQAPDGDHLYYVLALCRGLGGDLDGAYNHLKRAIELRPQNRILARNDPDFAEIGQQAPLAELLYPERTRLN